MENQSCGRRTSSLHSDGQSRPPNLALPGSGVASTDVDLPPPFLQTPPPIMRRQPRLAMNSSYSFFGKNIINLLKGNCLLFTTLIMHVPLTSWAKRSG